MSCKEKPYGYFYDNISRETDEFKELAEIRTAKPPIEIKDKPFGGYVLVCPYCYSRAILIHWGWKWDDFANSR